MCSISSMVHFGFFELTGAEFLPPLIGVNSRGTRMIEDRRYLRMCSQTNVKSLQGLEESYDQINLAVHEVFRHIDADEPITSNPYYWEFIATVF